MSKYALGNLLELKRGQDLTKNDMRKGIYPVVGSNGIIGMHNVFNVKAPCITVGRSGTVGAVHYYNENCWAHNTCLYVSDFKNNNPLYLYYLLKNIDLAKVATSTGVPTLNRNFVYPITTTATVNRDEQNNIANILGAIDEKIKNNNAISAKLESLAKTIYDYWFLQFEFPDEEGKPYKSSGGKMVWNDELKREIPEGWEVISLRGKYNIERGISYTSKDIESGKGLPMLNLACVDTSRNYRDGELKYTTGCVTESEKLHGGELLIACTDLTRNADIVGCPILVPQDGKTYTYSMDLAKIYSTASSLTNMYLYQSLRTDFYHRYIKKWASGTNVLHLNLDGLNWYSMALPPVLLQKKYASLMSAIEKKKSDILVENRQLTSLRDFLLPLLMNGQVTFKEDA